MYPVIYELRYLWIRAVPMKFSISVSVDRVVDVVTLKRFVREQNCETFGPVVYKSRSGHPQINTRELARCLRTRLWESKDEAMKRSKARIRSVLRRAVDQVVETVTLKGKVCKREKLWNFRCDSLPVVHKSSSGHLQINARELAWCLRTRLWESKDEATKCSKARIRWAVLRRAVDQVVEAVTLKGKTSEFKTRKRWNF